MAGVGDTWGAFRAALGALRTAFGAGHGDDGRDVAPAHVRRWARTAVVALAACRRAASGRVPAMHVWAADALADAWDTGGRPITDMGGTDGAAVYGERVAEWARHALHAAEWDVARGACVCGTCTAQRDADGVTPFV